MSKVRGKHTTPEMIVRRLLFAEGYRYRLHAKSLPGKPDLVFAGMRKAIFVHGCFWHGHGCTIGRLPKSRLEFWGPKIARNRQRDAETLLALHTLGWQTLTVWQCQTKDRNFLRKVVVEFLESPPSPRSTHARKRAKIPLE
jgi:DNA mismatch endonuclease (patch repair protein)